MSTTSRETVKTIGVWTLQRREFGNNEYDYIIVADGKPAVNLFVNDRPDFENERTVYTVEYTPNSRSMDLAEAADYVEHVQQALVAATEFQQAIDEAETAGHCYATQQEEDTIAAYSEALEAWERNNLTPNDVNRDDYVHHIIEAKKKLASLIGSQGAELLAIHDAITRRYFTEARARLSELTK